MLVPDRQSLVKEKFKDEFINSNLGKLIQVFGASRKYKKVLGIESARALFVDGSNRLFT
jgi:hypothetical protein